MTSARTNLGALTTTFTYPASCTVVVQQCPGCDNGWQAQTCSDNRFNTQGVQDNVRCWPEPENRSISTSVALNGWGFYSPGIACPVGYATSCLATGSVEGGFPFQFPLLESETAVGCCPTGFRCKYNPGVDGAQTCYSIATTGSFATVQCSSGRSNGFSYLEVPATVTSTLTGTASGEVTTSILDTVTVYAPLFQLNWKATDVSTTTNADSTALTQTTSSSLSAETTSTASSNEGLSTGAKAGIGVGVGIGGLLLIGAILFFFLRRRKAEAAPLETSSEPKPELVGQYVHPVELQGNPSPAMGRTELA